VSLVLEGGKSRDVLCSNTRTPSNHIQSYSFAEQKVPRGTGDGGYVLLSILAHEIAFLDQPLDFTIQLLEDLIDKGYAGEDARGLGE
jgi:hypothetical protein